jgi:hypothetical protein
VSRYVVLTSERYTGSDFVACFVSHFKKCELSLLYRYTKKGNRLPVFSDENRLFNGMDIGNANFDCVRRLETSRVDIAKFRDSATCQTRPPTPRPAASPSVSPTPACITCLAYEGSDESYGVIMKLEQPGTLCNEKCVPAYWIQKEEGLGYVCGRC